MIVYTDTSALVKLYVREAGSDQMTGLVAGKTVAVSDLAYAEAHATFARRYREGIDSQPVHLALCQQFDREWRSLLRLPVHGDVLRGIPELCRRHPLRAGDAVQLSSALVLMEARLPMTFASCDARLLSAAAGEGLATVEPRGGGV